MKATRRAVHRTIQVFPLALAACLAGPLQPVMASSPAAPPAPKALLARAARTMNAVRSLSVTGDIAMYSGRQRSYLHVTADCDASAAPAATRASTGSLSLRAQSRVLGHFGTAGKMTPTDQRFIVIGNGKTLRVWERSSHTENRWKENRVEGAGGVTYEACLVLFMSPGGVPTNTPVRYTMGGRTAVAGMSTWRVHLAAADASGQYGFDWFIDPVTARVLRSGTAEQDTHNPSGAVSTYTYSRFNAHIHITPPITGE